MSGHDDGCNVLFYTGQPAAAATTAMVCRGTILAKGKDVTLDAPGRVSITSNVNINRNGPPGVRVQLDTAKLALIAKP